MSEFASEGSGAADDEVRHIHAGESEIELDTAVDHDKAEWPGEVEDVDKLPEE